MKYEVYKELYDKLRIPRDIDRLAKQGHNRELLLIIYNQKIVRNSTRRFYEVKNKSKKLLREWRRGKSFVEIAHRLRFPSVLVAHIILKENDITRKTFWKFLSNPVIIEDQRLRRELKRVAKDDIVYSPHAMEENYKRGRKGEDKIKNWLEEHKFVFRTENDIKGEYPKTPDFLLSKPLMYNGTKWHWIESKASFGSPKEVQKNVRAQLKHYKELFGNGIVIYWFGYVDDMELNIPEGVLLADKRFFRDFDRNA